MEPKLVKSQFNLAVDYLVLLKFHMLAHYGPHENDRWDRWPQVATANFPSIQGFQASVHLNLEYSIKKSLHCSR